MFSKMLGQEKQDKSEGEMKMGETLEIIWSYEPADCFEEPFEKDAGLYRIVIKGGKATVTMLAQRSDENPEIVDEVFREIGALFAGAQVINHRPYELSRTDRTTQRIGSDGKQRRSVSLGSGALTLTGGMVDFVHTDADGNVIADTRADRIRERNEFAELAARHRDDAVAMAILGSYGAATRDPDNELVHLYEIYEALKDHFGSERNARAALGITKGQRSCLTQLANNEPLNQGRHRGSHVGQLRDATQEKLNEARSIAKSMIRAYLEYLDQQGSAPPNP